MHAARQFMTDTRTSIVRPHRPASITPERQLPATLQEINRYVGQMLTPGEQRICDMATD